MICTFFLSQWVNQYGACSGFVVAILVRALIGEPLIGLPDVLPLPWDKIQEDGHRYRLFLFRTVIMLLTIGTIFLLSRLAKMGLLNNTSDAETDTKLRYVAPIQTDMVEDKRLEKEQPLFSEGDGV